MLSSFSPVLPELVSDEADPVDIDIIISLPFFHYLDLYSRL